LTNQQGISPSTKRRPAFPTILGLAAIVFGLDQITKFLVLKYIPYGQSWEYLPWLARLFQITYIKNTGAAFGMFPQMGTILMVIAIVVVIGIILFHHHLPVNNIWVRLSLGLQLGGAMGNLLDRIIHGFVVDFIDVGFWPIFNIADASIVTGVSILAYFLWDEENPEAETFVASPQTTNSAAQVDAPPAQRNRPPSETNTLASLSKGSQL
jgi:signal peptidase II